MPIAMNQPDFDTIVIGRGLIGSAAARHLALQNSQVALVGPSEPQSRQAHSGVFASHYDEGRITRIIDPNPHWGLFAKRAIARYRELEEASGIHFYQEVGHLAVGQDTGESFKYLDSLCSVAKQLAVKVQILEAKQLQKVFPYFQFGDRAIGVWQKHDAGHISPRLHVRAQTCAVEKLGGTVFKERVLSVLPKPDCVEVCTEARSLTGRGVVVATGAFTNVGLSLPCHIPFRLKGHTVLLAEIETSKGQRLAEMPSVISKPSNRSEHFYLLPPIRYPNGKWYIKIGCSLSTQVPNSFEALQAWYKGTGDREVVEHLGKLLKRILPALDFVELHADTCVTTHTSTGYPTIDFLDGKQIVTAIAGQGLAGKSADELGAIAARFMHKGEWDYDIDREYFELKLD